MQRRYQAIIRFIALCAACLIASPAWAAAYGAGTYGNCPYGQGCLQIGPISLPATGPQLLAIVSALLIGIAAGWFLWLYKKRRRNANNQAR